MVRIDVERLSSLIESFYAAAYGRESWRNSMISLAAAFDASRAYILRAEIDEDSNVQRYLTPLLSIDDPEFGSPKAVEAFAADPLYSELVRMLARAQPGTLIDLAEHLDLGRLPAFDVWQEWFKPRDMLQHLRGVLNVSAAGTHLSVGIDRGVHQDAFDAQDRKLYSLIAPHLVRAGEISDLLRDQAQGMAFDVLPVAVVVVDRIGRIRRFNAKADALLSRADVGVKARNGVLRAATPADQQALAALVASAFVAPDETVTSATIVLPVDHHDQGDRGRLVMSAAPLVDSRFLELGGDPCAIVTIRELNVSGGQSFINLISRLFKLTPAQARLCARLSSGMSLQEAAAANKISYGTARSYLEVIFQKTGTRRQTELVALLKSIELLRIR
jgi:DNA-binding CsgD family transcriptional regulator